MEPKPKYPSITVQIKGQEGNAVFILVTTAKALRDGGVPRGQVMAFQQEACTGDYDHLVKTVREWVSTDI